MTNKSGAPVKDWAFLAYIAGDNDLSDAGLKDIREMCKEGSAQNTHVGVQIDTRGEHTGAVRYEISPPDWSGRAHRIVIERIPEPDTGDPEVLKGFLQWGYGRYPARNSIIVVWNHGAGFKARRRDIAYDDNGTSLDMNEISGVFERMGFGKKRPKISILGFDACLMNMLEIVHHLRNHVSIVVGSQQTEPNDGWPYDQALAELKAGSSPKALAAAIVDAYIASYRKKGMDDVTQSAIDAGKTEKPMKALSDLGERLAEEGAAVMAKAKALRPKLQSFEYADYVDARHLGRVFADNLPEQKAKKLAAAFADAVGACVIKSSSYGEAVKHAAGLSVWFPYDSQTYLKYRSKYLAMEFGKKYRGWVTFLDAYFS